MNEKLLIAKKFVEKNAPTILSGISILGVVVTTIFAAKDTIKACDILMEKEQEKGEPLTTKEKLQASWTCYIPTALSAGLTITSQFLANKEHLRRTTAFASAYSLVSRTLQAYEDKVIETIGEKKAQSIKDEVVKDFVDMNPPTEANVIYTGKGNYLCYDYVSGRYFRSNLDAVNKAINETNQRMLAGCEYYMSLNEFYDILGLPEIGIGNDIGWNTDHLLELGHIETTYYEVTGEPCAIVQFVVGPRWNFKK